MDEFGYLIGIWALTFFVAWLHRREMWMLLEHYWTIRKYASSGLGSRSPTRWELYKDTPDEESESEYIDLDYIRSVQKQQRISGATLALFFVGVAFLWTIIWASQ